MSTNQQKRMRALRGAITVPRNDGEEIVSATTELLDALISRNAVDGDDLVSLIFTATPDLDAEFPAIAARRLGLAHVPLLCSVELDVQGAMPRCVRVLAHLYTELGADELQHVYLREARELRADLATGRPGQGPKGDATGRRGERSKDKGEV